MITQGCRLDDKRRVHDRLARRIQSNEHIGLQSQSSEVRQISARDAVIRLGRLETISSSFPSHNGKQGKLTT